MLILVTYDVNVERLKNPYIVRCFACLFLNLLPVCYPLMPSMNSWNFWAASFFTSFVTCR